MEGFQPLTPVKEIPRVSMLLLSTKNRAWRLCMVCNAVVKTNYRSFSYGLQNAEELGLSRSLDTDIRFSNCKHFNKSTYHFLMQWLSSTKIPHKFCLYTSVANNALPHLAKASGLANTSEYWPLAMAVLVAGGVSLVKQAAWIPRVDWEWSWSFIKSESGDITIAILDGEPAWIWRRKSQQKGAAWKITDIPNPVGKFTNTSCPLARCIPSTAETSILVSVPWSIARPSGVLSLCTSGYLPT